MKEVAIAITGHRPDKIHLNDGYSMVNLQKLVAYYEEVFKEIGKTSKITRVISGMALGADQAAAIAAVKMSIPVTAAVPFKTQSDRWPKPSQNLYKKILDKATEIMDIEVVTSGRTKQNKTKSEVVALLYDRNKWMVDQLDQSGLLVALYDGTPGGTEHCVTYAVNKGITIHNIWNGWLQVRG